MSRWIVAAFCCALTALPAAADERRFEIVGLTERAEGGSAFSQISLRAALTDGPAGAAENAPTGLRLRIDLPRSSYDTGYDATPGRGTSTAPRLLLSYGMALSDSTTLTLLGGATRRTTEIRPVTASSPADRTETGAFVGAELEMILPGLGDLQILAEHDTTAGSFGALTYLHRIGSVRLGSTFSYYQDGDYSRPSAGLVAEFGIGEDADLRLTAAYARPTVGGIVGDGVASVQVQMRFAF